MLHLRLSLIAVAAMWYVGPFITGSLARDPEADYSAATGSLTKLKEQRRKDTADELERVRAGLAAQESRVRAMRQWTQISFDLDKRGRIPKPQKLSTYLEKQQRRKDATMYSLLAYRDQSRGEIKSGRALNFFLDECGPAAQEMAYCRTISRDQSKQTDADQYEREVLSGMTSKYVVDANMIRHIRYRRGLTGSKLTGRIGEKPLDLEHLNSVLRKDEFRSQIDRIASLRDRALAELEKGEPVTPDTAGKLMDSVQELLSDIRAAKKKQAKLGFNAMRPYLQAERQMFAIYEGAARLIEAYQASDVVVEEFRSGTIGDLLAYMQRNNLKFDAADDNGDVAYNNLYTLMSKYYLDLRSMQEATAESEIEYAGMKKREGEVADVKLGRSVSGMRGDLWGKTPEEMRETIGAKTGNN